MITFREYAEHLQRSAGLVNEVISGVVVVAVGRAERRARGYIGTYQHEDLGPDAPAWEPLSGATLYGFHHPRAGWIAGKEDLGYSPPDRPLERTGELRESISGVAIGHTGIVGSPSKKMLWQEMGTPGADYPIPPRPVLARAVIETIPDIEVLCGEAAMAMLTPRGAR